MSIQRHPNKSEKLIFKQNNKTDKYKDNIEIKK